MTTREAAHRKWGFLRVDRAHTCPSFSPQMDPNSPTLSTSTSFSGLKTVCGRVLHV